MGGSPFQGRCPASEVDDGGYQEKPVHLTLAVVGLNQVDQRLPGDHLVHIGQELLALGELLRRGLLVISKVKLLAAHQHCLG